jgi:hypothetical protein
MPSKKLNIDKRRAVIICLIPGDKTNRNGLSGGYYY